MRMPIQKRYYVLATIVSLATAIFLIHRGRRYIKLRTTGTASVVPAFIPTFIPCQSQTRIAFVKVHKAGSTTVMNILQRFGLRHNLTFVLPPGEHENYLNHYGTVKREYLLPAPQNGNYDILCNHVVYNRDAFRNLMPNNTVYIGILRQPFNRFLSAAVYNRHKIPLGYLTNIPGGDNYVHNLIMNYSVYEPKDPAYSVTNNRMTVDFGFPASQFNDSYAYMNYLEEINTDFDLILIMEYMVESLVLLKRVLCWNTQDIVFITRNAMEKYPDVILSTQDLESHRKVENLDFMLYDFFLKRFWIRVRQQGDSFIDEVNRFKEILQLVTVHCNGSFVNNPLQIKEDIWNDRVHVNGDDCKFMLMEEIPFVDYLRKRHTDILSKQ